MAAALVLSNLILLSLTLSVTSISKCDKNIVQKITSTNNCPKNVLSNYQANQKLISRVLWKDTPYKCVNVEVIPGNKVNLHMTAPYKQGSKSDVFNFLLDDKGCGHFVKSDDGTDVYYKQVSDRCLSLYTCSNNASVADGTPAPGCFFPVNKQNDADIQKCKDDLQATMPNVPLVIMPDCNK